MAFDLGFDFRATETSRSGPPYDPSNFVFATGAAFPTTYTNADGYSVNAGWVTDPSGAALDRNGAGTDARLSGIVYAVGGEATFKVDLSSGSAPGAGNYTIDMAVGDYAAGYTYTTCKVLDNTTIVIGNFTPTTSANTYCDATGAVRSPGSDSWDLVAQTASVTFASTVCIFAMNAAVSTIAHFRLTLQGGATDVRYEHIAHGIGRGILIGR